MKNKKLVICLTVLTVLLCGCTEQPSVPRSPYISTIEVTPSFVKTGSDFNINYIITNPLSVAFQGKVSYKSSSNCFYNQPSDTSVSVSANGQMPYQYVARLGTYSSKCTGTQLITLTLMDVDGKLTDLKTVNVNVVN